ncbi:PREDICTED: postreplication repair E3 ubiquitin-protein ligase RAD18-like [Dinoponera quadriceps]|uniref:RING-type E3 ubiquitin transferase n=1 Tax=Dinoponera quadriceps TaxID=609295 RepID=A0A6P3XH43_DINQU|nr:PREDICTED: postreplication repair E3 ubiquitin-protein ligase RAD18-like [Dinoponera quadriceps]
MLPTKYTELKRIEELLTCGICYEYMDTSMVTPCSHNYCSLCIRKYLHYQTQCPACFAETFEKDLRRNKILDEIIIQYQNVREKFEKEFYHKEIEAVTNDSSVDISSFSSFKCEKEIDVRDTNGISCEISESPISKAIISTPHAQRAHHQDVSSPSTSKSSKVPSIFNTPKSKKGFRNEENSKVVICPVCKVDVPESNINKHLDDCLKRENRKGQPKRVELKRKPLPKLVLNLMKDSEMRKKLKECGLSSQGERKVLENRLQRYSILYNAECDKTNPRPVSELIAQCKEEENLEKKIRKPSNRLNINRNTEQNVIEQERKMYLTEYKNSFDQLIAKIRTADNSQKSPVRRNILSYKGNFVSAREDCAKDRTVEDGERSDSLPANPYIDDSDSNTSCPLQTSENPMNFLKVDLSSSSNDNSNQYAPTFKQDTSNFPCNFSSTSFGSIVKTKNIKTELSSSKDISIREEVASNLLDDTANVFHVEECDVSENRTNTDAKESFFKLAKTGSESRKGIELLAKRNDSIQCNQEKYDTHSDSRDKWEEELSGKVTDPVVENIEYDTIDIDDADIQIIERSRRHNTKEYVAGHIKFEKENVESVEENIVASMPNRSRDNMSALRKRERDMVLTFSDDERIEDRSMNVRKSARFCLSETIGFNNESLGENMMQMEQESQKQKSQLRTIHAKNVNSSAQRLSNRLRSKINSNRKK